MQTSVFDPERLDALEKWARRVLKQSHFTGYDSRRASREPLKGRIELLPLDGDSLRPQVNETVICVGKDISAVGLGVLSDRPLTSGLYFVHVCGRAGIYLVRLVRERIVRGSVREYGFIILDHYESMKSLYET